ncbi:hypothetical protein CJJ07_000647 [Candidozyma auris]|nr:hypothetical protein CJJ07_000647 [[Candida] auris]QEL60757.1 hypothetical protein CJJ09_002875 [[Candida] auris]
MSFTCTPGQLVAHVISNLAVSDGISLPDLWKLVAAKSLSPTIDNLQKNIVWSALMGSSNGLIAIKVGADRSRDVPLTPNFTFGNLLLHGTEPEIFLVATEKCQFMYLTGTENYHALKTSLGDLPVQLLRVVARHGSKGILNADLARESAQDIRSLRVRLLKLEQAGLVVTKAVFIDKKHTTQSWHTKFAPASATTDNGEAEEDLETSRDVSKLRRLIVDAVQEAPNQLRGFSDLRKELKLDGSPQASKFFRYVCLRLHQTGYVEKVTVELPETKQRVYALKFIKPLPKDIDDIDTGLEDLNAELDDSDQDDDSVQQEEQTKTPLYNKIFPQFNQFFQQIYDRGETGITSGEIVKTLLGTNDYRPYARLFEALPSYLSNGKSLKACKKYVDPYDDYTISKLYDNEGKLKFYRYFVKQFCHEAKPDPKLPPKPRVSKDSIITLNKKLHASLGKTSDAALLEKKRRMFEISGQSQKRPRIEKKSPALPTPEHTGDFSDERPRRRRRANVSYNVDDQFYEIDEGSEDDYTPQPDEAMEDSSPEPSPEEVASAATEVANGSEDTLSSTHLPRFESKARKPTKTRTASPQVYRVEGSARSMQRRKHLLDIIREAGGATYSSSILCKKIDERMNNSTLTDIKTLARDVIACTKSNELEIRKVSVNVGEQQVEKKILLLTKPEDRPSEERLEELREEFAAFQSRKEIKQFQKRLIQSDLTLYVEKPSVKKASALTRKKRGKNRLRALGDDQGESLVKTEPHDDLIQENEDVLSHLKRTRRARKMTASGAGETPRVSAKRGRRNIKMEKSEALQLFRAVAISKAFSREAIDFDRIAQLFPDKDGQTIKQKWGTVRRSFGGADVVSQGVQTFQQMLMSGIADGSITEQHLTQGNLEFFLEYWREYDSNFDLNSLEGMPLFNSYERNSREYSFAKEEPQDISLAEKIEDISMRQKESVLCQHIFAQASQKPLQEKRYEELRSVLKSIFYTEEENVDMQVLTGIMKKYGESEVEAATKALIHDREVLFLKIDEQSKFVLGEKFRNALNPKVFTTAFFKSAASFKEILVSLSAANNGLILSHGVMPGEMATLLQLISDGEIEVVRVDRHLRFESYESRLIDKDQLSCDLILKCDVSRVKETKPKPVAIPFEGPCNPIWFDLNAQLHRSLWIDLITTILNYIIFKPGLTDEYLFAKMNSVLNVKSFQYIMNWLVESECIIPLESHGYLPTNKWQYILGSA